MLWQMVEQVKTGAPLPPEAIKSLGSTIRAQYDAVRPHIEEQNKYYSGLAKDYGLDVDHIIPPTFKAADAASDQGKILEKIKEEQPNFKLNDFMKSNIEANPGLDDYLKENPLYKGEMLQKYYDQLSGSKHKVSMAVPQVGTQLAMAEQQQPQIPYEEGPMGTRDQDIQEV